MDNVTAKVSIVVCTYNRAALLRDTIESLFALETAGQFTYEIVIVDNASIDDTPDVIRELTARSPVPLRSVYEPRPGVASARNRGIAEARTPWIAFFDDDQVADRHWLQELLAAATTHQVRCVGGANRLKFPPGETRPLARACRSLLGENGDRRPGACTRTGALGTGNMLIASNVFQQIGVFDETLREAGEDTDLYRRMWEANIIPWYTPLAVSYHVVPAYRLRSDYLRWKSMRHGAHVARRDLNERGRLFACASALARIGQAALVHTPRWLVGWMTRREQLSQEGQCRIWRAVGYCRFALRGVFPRWFPQRQFFSWLDFRNEQQMFDPLELQGGQRSDAPEPQAYAEAPAHGLACPATAGERE